jgi:hypothetical protein
MSGIPQSMASNVLNATTPTGTSGAPGTFTAFAGSAMKVRLNSTSSTASAQGTQLTGTGYTAGGTAVPAASTASSAGSNVTLPASSALSWTNGSGGAWSIVSFDLTDSAAARPGSVTSPASRSPSLMEYAWQQWVVQKTVQALGSAAADHLLFEMGNEPDNYAGLSGQQYYDTLWAPNVAALKAWARSTLGQEIFVGGPAWANSYTANLTDIGAWLTACKNAYVASGNRDHLPDFVSTHTYLSTPSENDTNAHAAARISTWGDFYRSLRVLINSTFSGLTDRGFPVADQLKVIDSEYNSTIDNASTVNNSSLFTDAYMINMFDMFRTSGVWAAVEFTIASHGGGALDLLTSGGAAKPLWTSLWAR